MGLLLFGNVTGIVWLEQCPQLFQGEYMCISSESVLGVGYGLTVVWECSRHGLVGAVPFENVRILQRSSTQLFSHDRVYRRPCTSLSGSDSESIESHQLNVAECFTIIHHLKKK